MKYSQVVYQAMHATEVLQKITKILLLSTNQWLETAILVIDSDWRMRGVT
jgi:hypothetical protein